MHNYLFIAHCCSLQKYPLLSFCSGTSILTVGALLELIFGIVWDSLHYSWILGTSGNDNLTGVISFVETLRNPKRSYQANREGGVP
jgi:hypothetical protein